MVYNFRNVKSLPHYICKGHFDGNLAYHFQKKLIYFKKGN